MTELQTPAEIITPHNTLAKFVTRIWEHPLLTAQTRRKREEALSLVDSRYKDQEGILLVPVGSSIWISGDNSDVDFMVLHQPDKEQELREVENALKDNRIDHDGLKPMLHFAGQHSLKGKFNFESDINSLALLFLTPDEYITGDHEWLKELRKKSLILQNYDGSESEYIHDNFEDEFYSSIVEGLKRVREWPSRKFANEYSTHFPRFLDALFDRAHRTRNPKKFTNLFYRNLSRLSPPDFRTIDAEIQSSHGEIHIDQRYIAQGL